jgi:hypothetical protein
MPWIRSLLPPLMAAFGVAGCSATYAFIPAKPATSSIDGQPATDYAVPPQSPHGYLRVASFGIDDLGAGEADQQVAALHIRALVSNMSTRPWTFDIKAQHLALEGHAASTPAFASASPGAGSPPPGVTIAAGATRYIDMFFPLPPDMPEPSDIPAFKFTSRLDTGEGPVIESTPFERVEVDGDAASAYDIPPLGYEDGPYGGAYWGSAFWYNTDYIGWGVPYGPRYWGRPYFAHGWGHRGYYRGGARGGYRGGFHGGFHGGGHR